MKRTNALEETKRVLNLIAKHDLNDDGK